MFKKILVALENSEVDEAVLPQVVELAKTVKAELLLLHVANGWVARSFKDFGGELNLEESEEMIEDRAYLKKVAEEMKNKGITVKTHLSLGDPPAEIITLAETEGCDLIAMSTHGHRFWGHLFLGNTVDYVRLKSKIPILLYKWDHS